MPQIKSAIKRVKTQEAARVRNIAQMNAMRTAVKKFKTATEQNADNSQDLYKAAARAIAMANSKALITQNKPRRANRRLSALLNK